jgi:hypothetical protein
MHSRVSHHAPCILTTKANQILGSLHSRLNIISKLTHITKQERSLLVRWKEGKEQHIKHIIYYVVGPSLHVEAMLHIAGK